MGNSEVMRVRLTADGIQEVVSSLKKVQGEVTNTAKAGKSASEALGSLGTIFAARQLAAFVSSALDAADGLFKMAQKTGVAVEQLSIFTYMGQQADVTNEDLAKGFAKLSKSMDALASGDTKTVEAFNRIGLSAEQLKGLSLDQVMLKIANAQAGFADGAGKAAVMMQVFGKSGSALIPLMNDLANGGFENAKTKLQELGLVISSDMAKASQDFNDSMKRLELAAQGAAVQVAQGVLPGLTSSIDALTKALAGMPAGTKAFAGSFVAIGAASTAAAVAVRMLYTAIAGLGPIGLAVVAVSALVSGLIALQASEDAARAAMLKSNEEQYGRVKTGKELVDQYQKEVIALDKGGLSAKARKEHEDKLKTIRDALIKLSPAYKEALDRETGSLNDQAKALKEVNRLQAEELENKRKSIQSDISNLEQKISAQRAGIEKNKDLPAEFRPMSNGPMQGEINRLQAIVDRKKAELASLSKPVAAATGEETTKKTIPSGTSTDKASAVEALRKAKLAEDLAAAKREFDLQKQNLDTMANLTENAYKDGLLSLKDYLDGRASFIEMEYASEVKALEAQIEAEETARAKAKTKAEEQIATTKIADLRSQITLKGNEKDTKLGALNRQGDQLAMEASTREQGLAERRLQLGQEGVDTGVTAGNLSEEEAITRKIALYQQYIPILRAAAEEQLRLAQAENDGEGNAEDILKAQENIAKVDALNGTLYQLGESLNWVKTTAKDAATSGLADFFMSLGDSATSLTDKIFALGRSIAQAVAQAAAMKMATSMMTSMGFAGGGPIFGPGTSTSDSIPIMASRGEFMVRAAAVQHYGLGTMAALNGLRLPKGAIRPGYADGGLVGAGAPTVSPGQSINGEIRVGFEEGLVVKHLKTPNGQKAILNVIANNPNFLRGLLGS